MSGLCRAAKLLWILFLPVNIHKPYDQEAFDRTMQEAVLDTVQKQVDAGISIVSDGETSKISYATYVKDRYTGFDGDGPRNAPADLKQFPSFLKRPGR
jgi:5-methyltetrahydropteroyltriglutamate--homocysteine methyltransferase